MLRLFPDIKSKGAGFWLRPFFAVFLIGIVLLGAAGISWAGGTTDADDIAENIVKSGALLPGLISAVSYGLALLFGVLGILKLKEHVEQPSQTELRVPIVRFLAGGALLSLPLVYEAMENAFNLSIENPNDFVVGITDSISVIVGGLSNFIPTLNVNNILTNFIDSIENMPGFVSALAYLLGLLLGVAGIIKVKDHVETPDRVELREGVIRLLAGGALFALPTVFDAMFTAITGDGGSDGGGGFLNQLLSGLSGVEWFYSSDAQEMGCNPIGIPLLGALFGSSSVGDVLCNLLRSTAMIPAFLTAIGYLFGTILGFWGILKVRDHVLKPDQVTIWEGFSRLIAGGAFFALPVVIGALRSTMVPDALVAVTSIATTTGFNENVEGGGGLFGAIGDLLGGDIGGGLMGIVESFLGVGGGCAPGGGGLDVMLYCFMSDVFAPLTVLLNFFGFVAGTILIMIGISRFLKGAQEGAKAPLGLGTLMTFAAGGALLSFNSLLRAFSTSFFTSPITFTYATLSYAEDGGLNATEMAHIHTVFSAVIKFVILVGLISFVRGLFIVRDVAEGNSQASMMAGITHILGGALAVNLGPLLNAVQATLGISAFGVEFS